MRRAGKQVGAIRAKEGDGSRSIREHEENDEIGKLEKSRLVFVASLALFSERETESRKS